MLWLKETFIKYIVEYILMICKRCSHEWKPRGEIFMCPSCKSMRWDKDEGIIRGNPDLDIDIVLDKIINNPIFKEDLMIIGGVVRN